MLQTIKHFFHAFGIEVSRYKAAPSETTISLKPNGSSKGNALLCYGIGPYLLRDGAPLRTDHTTQYESLQVGRTLLELGYALDVIHYTNTTFVPSKAYSIFIGVLDGFGRFAPMLGPECIKILHVVYAHCLYNNAAEHQRLLALVQRRGVTIQPRKLVPIHLAVEYADYVTILGNQFTMDTYRHAGKPMYKIPVSANAVYPWKEDRDFEACRTRFLWFGGVGLVHKGLDLVLEAFAQMPGHHLTVCGPIKDEKDFEKAFYRELYQTPNIRTVGWVDVTKPEFTEITNTCIGLIYPSCSEGQAGSVINCLHTGLIPVISYQSGVDIDGFGILLNDNSLAEITDAVNRVSRLPGGELKRMSRAAWEFARRHHTRERFAEEYKNTLMTILAYNRAKSDRPAGVQESTH